MTKNTLSDSAVTCVAPMGDVCGEGAVWDAAEGAVYWTDINRFLIHRLDEASGSVKSWLFKEPVVSIGLTNKPGCKLVAMGSRIIFWWPETDRREEQGFALPGWPHVRLNDGRPDPAGNFWVGSMKNNVNPDGTLGEVTKGQGVLFRITPQGEASEWRKGIGISNTLCWSPDKRIFYFGDTLENCISAYGYDAAQGTIGTDKPFFSGFERGLPDGSAMDSAGNLWNCRYGGGCVVGVSPQGKVLRVIELPADNITTCTFGGPDLKTLYITSARGETLAGNQMAGSLFAIRMEVPGQAENMFRLS